jgi:hypothetical protein
MRHMQTGPTSKWRNNDRRESDNPDSRTYPSDSYGQTTKWTKYAPKTPCGKQTEPQNYKNPSPQQTKKYAEPHKTRGRREKSKQKNASSEPDQMVSLTTTKTESGTSWSSNTHQIDYLERKDEMVSKQYENFMNILRKAKKPGWTSDQLNFIINKRERHGYKP